MGATAPPANAAGRGGSCPRSSRMTRRAIETAGRALVLACAGFLLVPGGCRRHPASVARGQPAPLPAPTTTTATGPSTAAPSTRPAVRTFESTAKKIRLSYPADWTVRPSKEYVLVVAPPGVEASASAGRSISLDVPDLPVHIPGLIPMGRVEKGYVDDLKAQWPGLRVEESKSQTVAGTSARRVRSTLETGGRARVESALIMVHADRVYILRADGEADAVDELQRVFDAVLASVEWVK